MDILRQPGILRGRGVSDPYADLMGSGYEVVDAAGLTINTDDDHQVDDAALVALMAASPAYSIQCDVKLPNENTTGYPYAWQFCDGSSANRADLYVTDSNDRWTLFIASGGVTQASIDVAVDASDGNWHTIKASVCLNSFKLQVDASAVSADAAGILPVSLSEILIGRYTTEAYYLNGDIRSMRLFTREIL